MASRQTRASKQVEQRITRSVTQKRRAAECVDDRVRKVSRTDSASDPSDHQHQLSDEGINEDLQSLIKNLATFKETLRVAGTQILDQQLQARVSGLQLSILKLESHELWTSTTIVERFQSSFDDILERFKRQSDIAPESIRLIQDLETERSVRCPMVASFLHKYASPPAPSKYARVSEWAPWQNKPTAILCGRPSGNSALPLSVFENVFRLFKIDLVAPPADAQDQTTMQWAFDVAPKLCTTMPNVYPDEKARGKVFQQCLGQAFGGLLALKITSSTGREAHPGGSFYYCGAFLAFVEYKNESGHDGDALMQLARDYQVYASPPPGERVADGHPMFLVAVVGIHFYVLGGFQDGSRTVVEPLARPCIMTLDSTGERETELARLLYSLRKGIIRLQLRIDNPATTVQQHPESTPRIYESFRNDKDADEILVFKSQLTRHHERAMLFLATTNLSSPQARLVMLAVGRYGDQVQRALAAVQLAPVLFGKRELPGAPTAYVMEYLSPASFGTAGWMTLFTFQQKHGLAPYKANIRAALDHILGVLAAGDWVHGDLRPPNMLVKVDADGAPEVGERGMYQLRVVDFDWAGKHGEVRYPLYRNDGESWPAPRGALIEPRHDVETVDAWWRRS